MYRRIGILSHGISNIANSRTLISKPSQLQVRLINNSNNNVEEEKYGGLSITHFKYLIERSCPFTTGNFTPSVTHLTSNSLHIRIKFQPGLIGNPLIPCLHGGVMATMMDHTAGFCAWASLTDGHMRVQTVDLNVDYLLPAPCEDLLFEAELVHASKKLIRTSVTCWDSKRLNKIGVGKGLFSVYKGKEDIGGILDIAMKAMASIKQP